ncbi:hypothetical protein L484_016721 [Morus notabilis]|uniref:Uncharacterized protein n=1 Tax=Morus notabilis TaxID=981085 RepID=W9REN9_9ROSA|nr:hypothetical protein L484_016721 [Morus notabilis]
MVKKRAVILGLFGRQVGHNGKKRAIEQALGRASGMKVEWTAGFVQLQFFGLPEPDFPIWTGGQRGLLVESEKI